ncbi:MAG: PAS domain-containing protein [Bacteroidales bacterium]|nr:PAS domain-containing protein [Bacteroidales bacterium]MCF8338292.1 PAS domain-containing protein [Bacteroidales bacterium]
MHEFYIIHLLSSLAYIAFAVVVLLRNRKARLHQIFGLVMMVVAIKSIALFFADNPSVKLELAKQASYTYFIGGILLPTLMFWFVLTFTKTLHRFKYKFLLGGVLGVALLFLWLAIDKNYYAVSYTLEAGYYAHWQEMSLQLSQFIYVFLIGLLSIFIVTRFGLDNIDHRTRNSAKVIAVAFIIIFVALLQDQAQYLIYKEKVFSGIANLLILLGSTLTFYLLIKRGIIIFSSSLLSENILENLTIPVVLVDQHTSIIYYNQAFKDMTAMSASQLKGRSIYKLLPSLDISPDDLFEYSKYGIHHIKTDLKDAFDNLTKIMVSGQTIFTDTGEFQGVVFSLETINKKPVPQSLQKDHEDRVMKAYEASDKGFWDWDILNGDLYFSDETYRLLGYSPEDLPNLNFTTWQNILHPDDAGRYFEKLNENLKNQAGTFAIEYRVKTKSGKWIWLLDRGRVVATDQYNNPARMSGMFTDITQIKSIEMQLRESRQQLQDTIQFKDRLIDYLSTDIREPFNAIIGLSEVLYMNPDISREERLHLVRKIRDESNSSFHLVEDILDYAKLEKEGPVIRKRDFSINELINEIHDEFASHLKQQNIQWEFNITDDIIYTDREVLKRVMSIVMDYAIRHKEDQNAMTTAISSNGQNIVFTIKGTGLTMKKEWLELLKKQPSSGSEPEKRESGLTLVLAKRLLEALDGHFSQAHQPREDSISLQVPVKKSS